MRTIKIGMIGLGHVGSAVVRQLTNSLPRFREQGFNFEWVAIAVRDLNKKRLCEIDSSLLTTDLKGIIEHPEIDVLIEVAGGVETIEPFLLRALQNKKHVITANKALMAHHGDRLLRAAKENGVWLGFEASCAGSIPIVKPLREQYLTQCITELRGIMNGTTNFILSTMEEQGLSYEAALKKAQDLGFAEADPSADVEGHDPSAKLLILSRLAFGAYIHKHDITRRGITKIRAEDISFFAAHGCRVKLIAEAVLKDNRLCLSVRPTILAKSSFCATMTGAENYIELRDQNSGLRTIAGLGAGGDATATAVIQDLIDVWRKPSEVCIQTQTLGFEPNEAKLEYISVDSLPQAYYVSLSGEEDYSIEAIRSSLSHKLNCEAQALNKSALILPQVTHECLTDALNEMKEIEHFNLMAVNELALPLLLKAAMQYTQTQKVETSVKALSVMIGRGELILGKKSDKSENTHKEAYQRASFSASQ